MGNDMEFHISCTAKVRRKAPVPSPTHALRSSDRMMQLKRALILGQNQHPSCGAAEGMLLQMGGFWEGSREQRGRVGAGRGRGRELEQLGVGEGSQATSSA